MTARANSLTARDTQPADGALLTWSMPANVCAMLRGRPGPSRLRPGPAAGPAVSPARTSAMPMRGFVRGLGTILSCAQRTRFTPNPGLELAQGHTDRHRPAARSTWVVTSTYRRSAVRQLARYLGSWQSRSVLDVREEDDASACRWPAGRRPIRALNIRLADGPASPRRDRGPVRGHQHQFSAHARRRGEFGTPPRASSAGAPWNGLSVPLDAWRLSAPPRDPVLRPGASNAHGRGRPGEYCLRRNRLALEVQRALASRTPPGSDARIESRGPPSSRCPVETLPNGGWPPPGRKACRISALVDDAPPPRKEAAGRSCARPGALRSARSRISWVIRSRPRSIAHFNAGYGVTRKSSGQQAAAGGQ
jgi:hypothetical protein